MVSLAGEFTKPDKNLEQENNFQKKKIPHLNYWTLFLNYLPKKNHVCVCMCNFYVHMLLWKENVFRHSQPAFYPKPKEHNFPQIYIKQKKTVHFAAIFSLTQFYYKLCVCVFVFLIEKRSNNYGHLESTAEKIEIFWRMHLTADTNKYK